MQNILYKTTVKQNNPIDMRLIYCVLIHYVKKYIKLIFLFIFI